MAFFPSSFNRDGTFQGQENVMRLLVSKLDTTGMTVTGHSYLPKTWPMGLKNHVTLLCLTVSIGWPEIRNLVFCWRENCPEYTGLCMGVRDTCKCAHPLVYSHGEGRKNHPLTQRTLEITRGNNLLSLLNSNKKKKQAIRDNQLPKLCFYMQGKWVKRTIILKTSYGIWICPHRVLTVFSHLFQIL